MRCTQLEAISLEERALSDAINDTKSSLGALRRCLACDTKYSLSSAAAASASRNTSTPLVNLRLLLIA
ncbi:hypothetical protein [Mycobacteroides chelonae]|uniref:hypothetical protein n=1 Tax=Mycobacteroides chelonae TaxID=1774 RepID=UPI001A977403|nr:hypothetical protein [Mycobacteroides chelonae]